MNREEQRFENLKETSRIEAFSDGVFAIAITLLILDIHVPEFRENERLMNVLAHEWPAILALLIGFFTILICWINHHTAFEYIRRVDTNLMWINGMLLFVVTLTPFPTAILAEYLQSEGGTAVAFFGFNYVLIGIAAYSICIYSYRHHLIDEADRPFFAVYQRLYLYSIFYTIIAFLLCFVSIVVPIIMYAILFTFFAAPKVCARKLYNKRLRS